MDRAANYFVKEDNKDKENHKEEKDSEGNQVQTKEGEMSETMVAYEAPAAIATRKRKNSYESISIANSPYYDQRSSPNNMHSNAEDNRALKPLQTSSFQRTTSEASSNSANRE